MFQTLATLWPYLRRYRSGMFLGLGALVLKDILGALLPLIIRKGVDSLTAGFRVSLVLEVAGLLAGASLLKGFFQYWMRVIMIGISRDIEFDLRNDLFAQLVRLSHDFYGRYRTGDIMARATNDLNAVRMMLGPGIMYCAETSLTLALAMGIMLSVDTHLTLIALSPAPVVSLIVILFGRRIHKLFEHIQSLFSGISSRVQENLAGVRVVRAYAQEEAEVGKFEELNREYVKDNLKLARIQGLFMPLLQTLIGITFLLVLWAGGRQLLAHRISLGSFVMFNTFMGILIWPMIAMGWVVNLMQRGTASLDRINEIMREKPSVRAPLPGPEMPEGTADSGAPRRVSARQARVPAPQQYAAGIRFRDVTVEFEGRRALDAISLDIEEGETVAIVGHTGSGKTTLVHLIPRLFDPTRGLVELGNRQASADLRAFDPEALRRGIGFVPQETFLFSATLAENIAWGATGAAREQIQWAAGIAGLGSDIASFPAGLDTVIGERGLTLSGGQKQRAAIARAILRNPRILILDDALSSVDTLTEERILAGLSGLMKDRTTILISHRVSTVMNADRIVVLSHGRIVEQGSHANLLERGGYYADLYQKQLLEDELELIS
jgi:ATP-binding cassette subfamily B multidrug efflux pump